MGSEYMSGFRLGQAAYRDGNYEIYRTFFAGVDPFSVAIVAGWRAAEGEVAERRFADALAAWDAEEPE